MGVATGISMVGGTVGSTKQTGGAGGGDVSESIVRRKAWVAPEGFVPKPTICPLSLTARASCRVQPGVSMSPFKSCIPVEGNHAKAWLTPGETSEVPTTTPPLFTSYAM